MTTKSKPIVDLIHVRARGRSNPHYCLRPHNVGRLSKNDILKEFAQECHPEMPEDNLLPVGKAILNAVRRIGRIRKISIGPWNLRIYFHPGWHRAKTIHAAVVQAIEDFQRLTPKPPEPHSSNDLSSFPGTASA